jgi:hypothetical protein
MNISQIIRDLKSESNLETAFFGFTEWTEHEFCIKANNDGLKLFAATILEGTQMTKEGQTQGLNQEELKWFKDELEINFIQWTNKPKSELLNTLRQTKESKWVNLIMTLSFLLLGYLVIAGIIFTIKMIAST